MKLLVCDVEGTIFKPHMIKDSEHASYIWTAIAASLGGRAEREEIDSQRKWRQGAYGERNTGKAYYSWVEASVQIHTKYGLSKPLLDSIIRDAVYVDGVREFFARLDRSKYIPVLISGGLQNLSRKACDDLGIAPDDSYAACEYFFDQNGKVLSDLALLNSSNFFGKYEIVQLALRKHGLGSSDWVFIGDGINDVSIAQKAPLAIAVDPIPQLREVAHDSVGDFRELMLKEELIAEHGFFAAECSFDEAESECLALLEKAKAVPEAAATIVAEQLFTMEVAKGRVSHQVGNLRLPELEVRAMERATCASSKVYLMNGQLSGIIDLLQYGEFMLGCLNEVTGGINLPSAFLQPFYNAEEIMLNVCFVMQASMEDLVSFIEEKHNPAFGRLTRNDLIQQLAKPALQVVLRDYQRMRNMSAHGCRFISTDVIRALVQRTYESIQRMELLVRPKE